MKLVAALPIRIGLARWRSDRDRRDDLGHDSHRSNRKEYGRKIGRTIAASLTLLGAFATATYGQNQAMRVEIKSAPQMVRNGEQFQLSASVNNLSNEDQSLQIWSCSFPQNWLSDNPIIQILDVSCDKDSPTWVKVKPGEAHEDKLTIKTALGSGHRAGEPVAFRLGFQPLNFQGPAGVSFPVWSNTVTIDVIEK